MNEEDEAWAEIERKQKIASIKLEDNYYEAVLAAQVFVESTSGNELAIMTLRKAFELGFRQGRM
jgi:hypothetical protein